MSTVTLDMARDRAARGAEAMDRMAPDWVSQMVIDGTDEDGNDVFQMAFGDRCVIGQVFGSWGERWTVASMLAPEYADRWATRNNIMVSWEQAEAMAQEAYAVLAEYGFYLTEDFHERPFSYDELTVAWREEIERRRSN